MKNAIFNPLGLLAATSLAASFAPTGAFAQNAPQVVAATPDAPQWQEFRLRNVSADVMAEWLTPAPNSKWRATHPTQAEATRFEAPSYRYLPPWAVGHSASETAAFLALPAGVQAIAPVDPQNVLWVLGTPAALGQMAEKIALLDKPLQQVEVEAQCIQISAADAKTLGIDFSAGQKEGKIEVGLANAAIQQKIEALVAQKRARIIFVPRVTAVFGAQASLTSSSVIPTIIAADNQGGVQTKPFADAVIARKAPYGLTTTSSIGLSVLPMLNANGSMTLRIGPFRKLGIGMFQPRPKIDLGDTSTYAADFDLDGIPTRPITLKEDQRAVLQGLSWALGSGGGVDSLNLEKKPPSNVIVIIRALRIRRAGDEEVVPVSLTR